MYGQQTAPPHRGANPSRWHFGFLLTEARLVWAKSDKPRPTLFSLPLINVTSRPRLPYSGWNGLFSLGSVVALTTPFLFMTPEARAQLVDIAEEIISDMVLNEPLIPFHREDLRHYFSRNWTKRVTGTESIPDAVQLSLAQEAATRMSSRFPSAQIVASNFPNSATFWGVMIVPQPGREWVDVLGEFLGPSVAATSLGTLDAASGYSGRNSAPS